MAPTGGKGPFEEQGGGRRGKALSEGEFLTDDLNMIKVDEEEGVYECAICGAQFSGINMLGQHCQVFFNHDGFVI